MASSPQVIRARCRFSKAVKLVRAFERARIPVFLSGPPGCAKSALMWQLCREDGIDGVDIRLALLNPVDLRGIPVVRGDKVVWVTPEFLVNKGRCRFLLDEITSAVTSVQATAYQWTLDKRIGEWVMDTTWDDKLKRENQTIIAAGNRSCDAAVVYQMPSPLRNRLAHVEIEPNYDDWKNWALNNGVHHLVINFLAFTANVGVDLGDKTGGKSKDMEYGLLFFQDKQQHAEGGFPTPRSWEFVSRFIIENPDLKTDQAGIEALVGPAVATKFCAFARIADQLPDPDAIVQGKSNVRPPTSPDAAYAFAGAVTAALLRVKDDSDRVEATCNAASYFVQHWKTNGAEFASLSLKDFARTPAFRNIYRRIITRPAWSAWTAAFGKLLEE